MPRKQNARPLWFFCIEKDLPLRSIYKSRGSIATSPKRVHSKGSRRITLGSRLRVGGVLHDGWVGVDVRTDCYISRRGGQREIAMVITSELNYGGRKMLAEQEKGGPGRV